MKKFLTLFLTFCLLTYTNDSFSQEDVQSVQNDTQEDTSSATVDTLVEETTIQVIEEEEIEEVVEESQSFIMLLRNNLFKVAGNLWA